MEKELCFIIENKKLYSDKILVTFNEFPIFFVCKDEDNDYYLVLCRDMENLEYILVKSSVQDIYDMLIQKCSIKEAFLKTDFFYEVFGEIDLSSDRVNKLSSDRLDVSFLPNEDIYYEAQDACDIDYIANIAAKF